MQGKGLGQNIFISLIHKELVGQKGAQKAVWDPDSEDGNGSKRGRRGIFVPRGWGLRREAGGGGRKRCLGGRRLAGA
jgi:hypothetical protein